MTSLVDVTMPDESIAPTIKSQSEVHAGRSQGLSRRLLWGAALAFCVFAGLSTHSLGLVGLLLGLSLSAAIALVPRDSQEPLAATVVAALPAGFVLTVAWSLVWGLALGALDLSAWNSRAAALAGVATFLGATGFAALRRAGRVRALGADLTAGLGAAAVLAFFLVVTSLQPLGSWSRINSTGTDFLRHLGSIRDVAVAGSLEPGQPGYPKGLYAVSALLLESVGGSRDAQWLWSAMAPISFLMLALVLLSFMSIARRSVRFFGSERNSGDLAAGLTMIMFVQTCWFGTFQGYGNVMNELVGVCLAALLGIALQPWHPGRIGAFVVAVAAVAVTANAWQLMLPAVGLCATPILLLGARSGWRKPAFWLVGAVGAVLALNGMVALRGLDTGAQASIATIADLFRPEWWWGVALGMSLLTLIAAWRSGRIVFALSGAAVLAAGAASIAFLMLRTGSTWDLMLYYPVKTLWTLIVVAVPLASAAGVAILRGLSRGFGARSVTLRAAGLGTAILAIGVLVAAMGGRAAAERPALVSIAGGDDYLPNWPLALINSLEDSPVPTQGQALVLGLVPAAAVSGFGSAYAGSIDFMAMEALDHLGVRDALYSPVKDELIRRDLDGVCQYLRQHPAALRVTGPDTTGPGLLLDAGCPEDVVSSEDWVTAPIGSEWLRGSPWELGESSGPTPVE